MIQWREAPDEQEGGGPPGRRGERRKRPFSAGDVCEMVDALRGGRTRTGRRRDARILARDAALLLVGFAAGLGCEELGSLELADLGLGEDGAGLRIDGAPPRWIERIGGAYCPVAALEAWLEVRGREPGPLFVGLRGRQRKGLSPMSLWYAIQQAARAAGLPLTAYGRDSLRRGFRAAAQRVGEASVVRQLDR